MAHVHLFTHCHGHRKQVRIISYAVTVYTSQTLPRVRRLATSINVQSKNCVFLDGSATTSWLERKCLRNETCYKKRIFFQLRGIPYILPKLDELWHTSV